MTHFLYQDHTYFNKDMFPNSSVPLLAIFFETTTMYDMYVHICACVDMYIYVHVYMWMCQFMYVNMEIYIHSLCVCVNVYIYMYYQEAYNLVFFSMS